MALSVAGPFVRAGALAGEGLEAVEIAETEAGISKVLLDTNTVIEYDRAVAEGLIEAGETPVITDTVLSELQTLVDNGHLDAIPNVVNNLEVISDAVDVSTQGVLRQTLAQLSNATGPLDAVRGLAGDAIIGNTAILNNIPLITRDAKFAAALTEIGYGALVRLF
jgi:predicted nucleic acid-binding protein